MPDLCTLAVEGPIARLTFNRPEARNSLSLDLLRAMHARVDELRARADAVVAVVTGEGKAYCAGMDLKAILGDGRAATTLLTMFAELTWKIRNLPQVTIARVNGAAIGGGCGLAVVADLAITHADAKVGFPEVDLGVSPAVVAPWLVKRVGPARARAILLRGGLMTGAEAHAAGFIDECVPMLADLDAATDSAAKRIAGGGRMALRATKGLLNEIDGSTDLEPLRRAGALSAEVFNSPEAQERMRAKVSK
ncbi:MAG: enoyl-CoA hydratase/isomerase family protein [Phycisphaerae bacterium]|nr:enoyl-CoA hydratase/isomerase family protein [Phycisphaerae bacterium]